MLRSSDNNLVRTENKRRLSDFMQGYFNARMQTNKIISINNKKYLEEFNCDEAQCFIGNNYKLYFPRNNTNLLLKIKLLDNKDLKSNGSYFITLKPSEPKIESVIDSLQYRPWS